MSKSKGPTNCLPFLLGWGTTETGDTSEYLRKLPYTITPKADCTAHYGESILPGMMCTGTTPKQRRADTGDSGRFVGVELY